LAPSTRSGKEKKRGREDEGGSGGRKERAKGEKRRLLANILPNLRGG